LVRKVFPAKLKRGRKEEKNNTENDERVDLGKKKRLLTIAKNSEERGEQGKEILICW